MRLEADGRFGPNRMKLMVSQNAPFVPMYDAWRADSRHMLPYDDHRARRDAGIIDAKVLSNRRPPYGLAGGLYDALKESGGDFFVSTNAALRRAAKLFEQTEGIDIHHAAAVAVDSLIQAVKQGKVGREDVVMLNVTGGGERRYKAGRQMWYLKPSIVFPLTASETDIIGRTEALFVQ